MSFAPVIGIDLGTTFSLAAVHKNGKTEIIPDLEGKRLIPSCIFYKPDNLEILVGSTAEDLGIQTVENLLFDVKRIIGRKFDDAYVQKLKDDYRFSIVRGEDNKAEIKIKHDGVYVSKTPEQASSEVLKYLREQASNYLEADVREAVISVPARFSNAQKKATRDAAVLAGLRVRKLITEPVAAAIHYCEDKLLTEGHILVFDLGGGTLDVSIINVENKTFLVKNVDGNTFLGGRDFDNLLLNYVKQQISIKYNINSFSKLDIHRIMRQIIKAKCKLSTLTEYCINIPVTGGVNGIDCSITITRSQFESINSQLIDQCIQLLANCIDKAGLSKDNISEIVLVGGSTRVPKIRQAIQSFFGDKVLKTDLNPDEAVAIGAAIQAAILNKEFREFKKYKITEVTPLSLGISLSEGVFRIIIKRNTPLPVKSKSILCHTIFNNRKSAEFKIYEGNRKRCEFNNLLGTFSIHGLPPAKAGDVLFNINFSLDEDGILEVEAWETVTKKKNKLLVTLGAYGLCDYKVNYSIEDSLKNRKEDEKFQIFAVYKSTAIVNCQRVIYDLEKIPDRIQKAFTKMKCNSFETNLETIKNIDELRAEYNTFITSIKSIISLSGINLELEDDEDIYEMVLQEVKVSDRKFYTSGEKKKTNKKNKKI